MYDLKEAGIITFRHLVTNLAPHGYHPCTYSPGLWTHITRNTIFTLAVDDVGIKYFRKEDTDQLYTARRVDYIIFIDWTGRNYCDWYYGQRHVDVSIPGYIVEAI